MFHSAAVRDEGNVVDGCFQLQYATVIGVHLHPRLTETTLNKSRLDLGADTRSRLLGHLEGDLVAEEGGYLFSFHAEHRLACEWAINGTQVLRGTKERVGRISHLLQAPAISPLKDITDWATPRRASIRLSIQFLDKTSIDQLLRTLQIDNLKKGIVGCLYGSSFCSQHPRQPTVPIAIQLQSEGRSGRYQKTPHSNLRLHHVH
jgi:hypothetical protein